MSSFTPGALDGLRLTHGVVATVRAIGEGKGKQDLFKERAPDALENLRQVAIIESTKSSNRLEVRRALPLLVGLAREHARLAKGTRGGDKAMRRPTLPPLGAHCRFIRVHGILAGERS